MKVITCFSYKGGAGRTVAAGNIAAALASSAACGAITKPLECKVALIDLDVFSAGTHRVFEIGNPEIQQLRLCVQDYLQHEIKVGDYLDAGGLTPDHEFMEKFKKRTHGCCLSNLTLLPAKPVPDRKFAPQKYHENQLLSLILELEQRDYHYVILDGENGMRAMADIALRLADVVLMFFRLTWQHIEGTLEAATSFSAKPHCPAFYLIPTCLPLVEAQHRVYQSGAPGLKELQDMTKEIPVDSKLDAQADSHLKDYGHFWGRGGSKTIRSGIHDSLALKGGERVLVYDKATPLDPAAIDYYHVAAEIKRLHKP